MKTPPMFNLETESGVLRVSVIVTLVVAALGIVFGLVSGSFSIAFDGVYSLIDASMSMLSLMVSQLIIKAAVPGKPSSRLHNHFSMGLWHLEPMVLGFNGTLLIGVAVYALINAVSTLLNGGRDLEFGWAILYALITALVCLSLAMIEKRANRSIGSQFVQLDIKGWIMSGCISGALLIAFAIGYAVQGTSWEWISPYIDPAVLAVVCIIIIPIPIAIIRQALADIFVVTPADLKEHVNTVASAFTQRHGFSGYRAYVARMGRGREIELYFIVPPNAPAREIAHWDALRDEIGDAVGGEGPDRWITVIFTGNVEWAE